MTRPAVQPLQRQIRRVRQRLFLQLLFESVAIAWFIALVAAAGWFAAQPHVLPEASPTLRWKIAAGLVAVAAAGALVRAALRRPSAVAAALAIDERCGLKERVTTSLMLTPRDSTSPAAVALLEDVNSRVARVLVPQRFPVRLPRSAWLVPLAGTALALVALFYKPAIVTPKAVADEKLAAAPDDRAEIDKRMEQLRKSGGVKKSEDKNRSAELERMESELERLSRQPRDTKDQARDIVKDLSGIEEQIKKREQQLTERADALKEQMKQAARLSKDNNNNGPAKQLEKALAQGDLQKAKKELDRLAQQLKGEKEADRLRKKLDDKNTSKEERAKAQERLNQIKSKPMTKQDKEDLSRQMKDAKEKLDRLSRSKEDKEKALRDKAEKGEIDKDQLQRELDRLERDAAKLSENDLQNLKDVADKIEKAEELMQQGEEAEAGKTLEEAGDELGQLDREGELQELKEKEEECEGAKGAMCEALDGKPVPSAGRRRESKETVTNSVEKRERANMDKGKLLIVDTLPGEGFKGPRKPAELTEEIRRATQEAPEAIDRQRLPRSAGDMARGYFDRLRGEQEKKDKP
jgi:hypothetical protein